MRFALRRRVHTIALFAIASLLSGVVAGIPVRAAALDDPAPIDRPILNATGRTSALVHVESSASLADGLGAARAAGLETGTTYDAIGVFVAYGSAAEFGRLAKAASIQYVEANRRISLALNSSHKATRGQDVLDGAVTLPGGTVIDGSGVGVAVVDSGIEGTHPDLASRMGGNVKVVCSAPLPVTNAFLGGFQECRGPKEIVPLEDTDTPSAGGHGTHVAGIVAGTGSASNGVYHGAAPGATLYGVSVGTVISVENGLDGLAWVLENHDQVTPAIKVVNNSWGSGYRKYSASGDPLYSATWKLQEELVAAGVTVVFAAGNSAGNGSTPTTFAECLNPTPGVVCVANYDDKGNGTRAGTINSSSSRGSRTDVESWPDVSAPGTSIQSTCRLTLPVCDTGMVLNPPNLYALMSGTSMAAPHVAGIVAQLYQADPTLTPAEIENILEDTAHKFSFGSAYGLLTDPTNPDNTSSFEKGHGLVDALAAVQTVLGGGSTDPTTPPTTSPDPSASPTASPTVSPTTSPTSEPTGGTRYYFHSVSGLGVADTFFVDGQVFDTNEPTNGYSEFHDIPLIENGAGGFGPYDPNWSGTVAGPIESLTLDFWVKTPAGDLLGAVNYDPTVWVGNTAYALPTLSAAVDPTIGNAPTRLTRTYTTMLDAAGKEVPLAIDPGSQDVTITISGRYYDEEAGSWIVYDDADFPSGFVVNGNGTDPTSSPSPTPSSSPTVDPTTEPTPTPAPGRGTYPADPNDPLFDEQWGMTKIQAPQAWQERNATGFGINIAIVDSGVDVGHPDLSCNGKMKVLPESDVSSGDDNPQDTDGHGSHVAGIAAACTNNGTGVVGVAPDASIIPVRATGGDADLDQSMADGIRFAADHGAHVVNLSIGDIPPFSHFGPDGYPQTEEALEYARDKGVVIAAAAGNFAQPTCEFPSLSRNVICAVATDRDDNRAVYSDLAVNVDRNADEPKLEPVVAAPGGDLIDCAGGVTSTYLRSAPSTCHSSGYDSLHGTSMASPHVAGVAALLYDRLGGERSRANADLIVQTILDTSEDLYTPGWDPMVGYGRVDALAAVRAIDVPEPSATAVTFTDNTSETVQYSDSATFEAQLRDTVTGEPIPGAQIVFRMSAGEVAHEFIAFTNDQGIASVTYLDLKDAPGAYDLTARFLGQGEVLLGSADVRALTVQKELSALALTVQKSKTTGKTATATLTDADTAGSGVAGKMVEFFVDGRSLGFAMTDENGRATVDVKQKNAPAGQGFSAVFAGDELYEGSSAASSG